MYTARLKKPYYVVLSDYLICLIALAILSFYYYGLRAIIVVIICIATSLLTDYICVKLRGKNYARFDISAIISGFTFALLLPASVSYTIAIISCIFMIVVGKQAFGGNENPVFSTVSVGFSFAVLCFNDYIFHYPIPTTNGSLPLDNIITENLVPSFTHSYSYVADPSFDFFTMLLGRYTGPMGTTHIIILAIAAFILLARGSISKIPFVVTLFTVLGFSFLFPAQEGLHPINSVLNELFGSSLLFALTFVACDFKFVPKRRLARILYGLFIGALTIMFRRYANYEIGIFFALLIAIPIRDSYEMAANTVYKILKFSIFCIKKSPFFFARIFFALLLIIYTAFKHIFIFILAKTIILFLVIKRLIKNIYIKNKIKSQKKAELKKSKEDINIEKTNSKVKK